MHQANVDLKRILCRASLPLRLAPCSLAEERAELLISSHVGPAKPRVVVGCLVCAIRAGVLIRRGSMYYCETHALRESECSVRE